MNSNNEKNGDVTVVASSERDLLAKMLRPILNRARQVYDHAITSLWIGNASAALATLSFIGATWKDGTFFKPLLWPFGFFISGLVAMGFGSLVALITQGAILKKNEYAESFLDVTLDVIQSSSEEIGLALSDPRTIAALVSGALFISGAVIGFFQLLLI